MDRLRRKISEAEIEIIRNLLARNFHNFEAISEDINDIEVNQIDEYGSIELLYQPFLGIENLRDGPFVTGLSQDGDNSEGAAEIEFILFSNAGHLSELQIYKQDGGPILSAIDPSRIRII